MIERARNRTGERRVVPLLALLIALCVAVASVWLARVPIFGEPDENTHADYALTLWAAGRLIRAGEHPTGTDVSPDTRALAAAGDFDEVRFDAAGRVEPGYGSAAYWRAVDRAAPDDAGWYARATAVPYIAASYPFGFYGLEALVFGAARALSGSLVTGFFAMRAFCVVLLAVTLALAYAIAREMKLTRARALAVVAIAGLFPTVSWNFAYVQPDDLATVLVELTLYLTLRARRLGLTLARASAIGVALAALSLVKLHTCGAVAVAVVPTLAFSYYRPGLARRGAAAIAAVLIVPALLATVASSAIERHAPTTHDYAHFAGAFGTVAPASAIGEALVVARDSLTSIYDGNAGTEYEHDFSWLFTRISFGSDVADETIDVALQTGTFVVLGLVTLRVVRAVRVARRLARSGKRVAALRLLTHDPVWNAYVAYIAVLVVAEVYVDAHVHLQGRYLVPVVVPAILCAVRYAPNALRGARREPLARIATGVLLAYSLAGAVFGLRAIDERFYRPGNDAARTSEWGIMLNAFGTAEYPRGVAKTVARGSVVRASGWAFDSHRTQTTTVVALLDGRDVIPVRNGIASEDEVDHLNDLRLAHGGFDLRFDTSHLSDGAHSVTLYAIERGRRLPEADGPHRFEIVPK